MSTRFALSPLSVSLAGKQNMSPCPSGDVGSASWLTSKPLLGGGLFGFDISSMSGVLGTNAYKNYFNHPVSYHQGAITAAMPAGSFIGTITSSFIADRFSRKSAIQAACVIWILGSALVYLFVPFQNARAIY
jgi:MFS family permease